ncbi:OLC1v1008169C1 [Oldenlandia corymbosa var. corymbosa]|uniref:OLC1v1008169C1 n=1 Tax=Oldenlandia corymbosa var. corymbosa TaxID=529605 RepID=A0AAV1DLG2_OLDCO|nr:OLC1v1008169C1 [Oldenlandia corymbosa var. corymbosa]
MEARDTLTTMRGVNDENIEKTARETTKETKGQSSDGDRRVEVGEKVEGEKVTQGAPVTNTGISVESEEAKVTWRKPNRAQTENDQDPSKGWAIKWSTCLETKSPERSSDPGRMDFENASVAHSSLDPNCHKAEVESGHGEMGDLILDTIPLGLHQNDDEWEEIDTEAQGEEAEIEDPISEAVSRSIFCLNLDLEKRPNVVGILEPRISRKEADEFIKESKFERSFRVEARGFSREFGVYGMRRSSWKFWNITNSLFTLELGWEGSFVW